MMDKKRFTGSYCAAVNCSNNRLKRPDLSYFRFPLDRYVLNFFRHIYGVCEYECSCYTASVCPVTGQV